LLSNELGYKGREFVNERADSKYIIGKEFGFPSNGLGLRYEKLVP